jgi:hypothetical protein
MEHIDVETFTGFETEVGVLSQGSGVFDDLTGVELTNQEVISAFLSELHGGEVFMNPNGLSQAAEARNREVMRGDNGLNSVQKAAGQVVAFRVRRPVLQPAS